MSKKKQESPLWQLDVPGAFSPSFLFGTMHVRDERAYGWFDRVEACMERCECLALEIDLQQMPDPESLHAFQLPDGMSLRELIGEKAFSRGRSRLQKVLDIDLLPFQHMRPLLAVQAIDSQILKGDRPLALDEALFQLALEKEIPVLGLESVQSQIELMKRIPLDHQARQLKRILRSLASHRKSLSRFADWYAEGRIHQIYKVARRGAGPSRRAMIYERNEHMTQKLMELMADRAVFAAVGVGHLPGKEGMLRKLKSRGVKLEPLGK